MDNAKDRSWYMYEGDLLDMKGKSEHMEMQGRLTRFWDL
jgi:hypothetical protein